MTFSYVEQCVDEKRLTSQVASTPSLQLHAQAVDGKIWQSCRGGGHAANPSSRTLAEQRAAADYGPTKSLPVGGETAARAVTLLEASATQRQHIATSETRSRKWLCTGRVRHARRNRPVRVKRTVAGSGLIRMPVAS